MTSSYTACRTAARSCREFLQRGFLALAFASVALLGVNVALAQAAPTIDGNLDDMITYAQSLQSSGDGAGLFITDKPDVNGDPTPENIYNDAKFIPCPLPQPAIGTHWVNGVEIFRHVLAYTPGSSTLYLGLRSEGFIGDSDGNGNPDNAGGGTCNPDDNIEDLIGISGNELYNWSFDLNCDGVVDGMIKVADNTVTGSGTLAGITGNFAFRQGGPGNASGKDLEIQVNLVNPLPAAFRFVRVEANAFDGLSEDRSDGAPVVFTPKIDVVKSAEPVNVCVDGKTRFTLTISNTGQTPLSVVAIDNLPAVLSYAGNLSSTCGVGAPQVNGTTLTFPAFDLAAGANCTISFDALAGPECFGQVTNHVDVTGKFTSSCIKEGGSTSVNASADFSVVCKAKPCVEVTASGPPAACPGAPVTISGTAKNCSQDPETIVVKVNGAQAYNQVVAAGETIQWSFPTTMPEQCVAGQNSNFAVEATGSNDCGSDVKTASVDVRCKDKPCLELTTSRQPDSACPGDQITISGTVKNCSLDPETIVVTVLAVQVFNGVVAPGETKDWTTTVAMPQCTAGSSVLFPINAIATGDCPLPVTKTDQVSVLCKNPPCVTVTAAANKSAACPNEEVVISGKVTNCGTDPADYTVKVGDVTVYTGTLAPGAEADYNRTVTMGDCVANGNVSWTIVGTATNSCGSKTDEKSVSVRCKDKPCLELTSDRKPDSACPGDQITISGTVKNCSLEPETIVVTVLAAQVFNGVVAPGETKNWTTTVTMPQCTAGSAILFPVNAIATGDCPLPVTKTDQVSVQCKSPPCVSVTAEANKSAACPNETVTISGKVKNCGTDAADYVVTVGGVQVFAGPLAPGVEQEYSKDVSMGECVAGSQVSTEVVATAHNTCGDARDAKTVSVRCKDKPCLELTSDRKPDSACPGDQITISGTVKNCSLDPETIVVTVLAVQVFNGVVAPGETKNWTTTVTMPQCTAGSAILFPVSAIATGDCPLPVTKTDQVSVQCKSPPCVSVTADANKSAACPNETVTISGKVKNCGTDVADYIVTVGGVQVFAGSLQPGAEQAYTKDVTMGECVAGSNVSFEVVATAHNSCGDARDAKTVDVRCKAKPCVELTADVNPKSACPGDALVISGSVKNCSIDPETIVVTINEEQVLNQLVAAGATVQYTKSTTMPACQAGGTVPFHIVAKATNDCDQVGVQKTADVSVSCKNPPCVELLDVTANKSAACPNDPVTISGKVKNCGTDAATFTVSVGGVQVYTGSLDPGAVASFSRDVTMGDCVAGNDVTWLVSATATNSCGQKSVEQNVSVRCNSKPCVQVTAGGPPSSCTGQEITISGKAKNCSPDAETILVTVDGQQVYNASVPGNTEVDWSTKLPMKECTAGQKVTYAIVAKATNSCGDDQKTASVDVLCLAPPCLAIDLNAPAVACAGSPVQLCGSVTNCSSGPETIEVHYLDQSQLFTDVPPGTSKNYCFQAQMGACTSSGVIQWTITAAATNSCGRVEKTALDETKCKLPMIKVKKAGESEVDDGGIIHYTIIVENPGDVDLQNVVITDTMCRYTVYNDHANPAAFTEPAIGQNGLVVWKVDLFKAGESRAFTFEAKASLAAGNFDCSSGGSATCTNNVEAKGSCAGSDGSQEVTAHDDLTTTIHCAVCTPRIAVTKTVSPSGPVDQGTTLHYTITVSNPGSAPLTGIVVTDYMCSDVTYANNASPAPVSAPAVGGTGNVVWNLASLAAGAEATFTFDAIVNTDPNCSGGSDATTNGHGGPTPGHTCTNNVTAYGFCGDAKATATASVDTPINCPVESLCRITGGGCLNEDGDNKGHKQSTFGGNASPEHSGGGPTGNSWEHVYRDGKTILFNWHSWDAHVIDCSVVPPGPCSPKAINTRADFVGTGKYSIGSGGREEDGNMVAYIIDHNEGSCNKGTRDEYSIVVRKGLVIGEGEIVFQTSGYIDCGNLQIHETPARLFGSGITPPSTEGDGGPSVVNRVFPNPFSGSTNFAYRVDADSRVEVGVYNVAGRLVKTLAAGSQPSGTYVVTWDGSDEAGVRMAPGVYFLKSLVGASSTVTRLIYVAR